MIEQRPEDKDPVQHLYDQMDQEGLNKSRSHTSPPQRFRASEAANCMRAIWYRLSGWRPVPRTSRMAVYGICGDADHDMTRQLMTHYGTPVEGVTYEESGAVKENMYVLKTYHVPRPDVEDETTEIDVVSRADGEMATAQGMRLVEIKGTGFYPYKWLHAAFTEGYKDLDGVQWPAGHDAVLARVKDKHSKWYRQMQVTMSLSGYDDRGAYLIVKERDSGTLGVYNEKTGERTGVYIPFEPDMFQEILDRFAHVKRSLKTGEVPTQEYPSKSRECEYCDFRWACHGADERRAKGLKPALLFPGPQTEVYNEPAEDADSSD